jgi:FK506-binding protein 4/5
LQLTTRLNLSTCFAKLGNATKALENAQQALAIDSTNTKALFRRGQAYLALGDIDRAREDLEKVKEKLPNDSSVKAEMEKLRKKTQEQQKKEKKLFSKMFEKMSTNTE